MLNCRPIFHSIKRFIKIEIREKVWHFAFTLGEAIFIFLFKLKERRSAKNQALEYFDFYYGPLFDKEWNKIRLALLTGRKHVCLVNNYTDSAETIEVLKKQTAIDLFETTLKILEKTDTNIAKSFKQFNIPKNLKVFTFDVADNTSFPAPKSNLERQSSSFVINFYLNI